jgi:hypothetical protein
MSLLQLDIGVKDAKQNLPSLNDFFSAPPQQAASKKSEPKKEKETAKIASNDHPKGKSTPSASESQSKAKQAPAKEDDGNKKRARDADAGKKAMTKNEKNDAQGKKKAKNLESGDVEEMIKSFRIPEELPSHESPGNKKNKNRDAAMQRMNKTFQKPNNASVQKISGQKHADVKDASRSKPAATDDIRKSAKKEAPKHKKLASDSEGEEENEADKMEEDEDEESEGEQDDGDDDASDSKKAQPKQATKESKPEKKKAKKTKGDEGDGKEDDGDDDDDDDDEEDDDEDPKEKLQRTIFVGCIPHKMTKKQVKALFKDCGEIDSVRTTIRTQRCSTCIGMQYIYIYIYIYILTYDVQAELVCFYLVSLRYVAAPPFTAVSWLAFGPPCVSLCLACACVIVCIYVCTCVCVCTRAHECEYVYTTC